MMFLVLICINEGMRTFVFEYTLKDLMMCCHHICHCTERAA
jgi:hypothetical protein